MKAAFICDADNVKRVYSQKALDTLHEIFDFYEGIFTKKDAKKLFDVECLFSTWGMPSFTEDEIKAFFPKLKIVFYAAGSVQHFARPFLNLGIKVISGWMANAVPVIEYTVAQIILANKGFYGAMRICNSNKNYTEAQGFFRKFPGSYGANVGLISLGAIGSGVAKRLKDYNLNVLAYDPFISEERAKELGVTLASLEELFESCQVISNHAPNLPTTQKMIDKRHFSRMQETATFINTGRGAQLVEEDLLDALRDHPYRSAVLDVTDPEPPISGSELYSLPNVFLTPHIAGSIGDECMRMSEYIAEDAAAFASGNALKYEVSIKMLDTMA